MGAIKKIHYTSAASLSISRNNLYRQYLILLGKLGEDTLIRLDVYLENLYYTEYSYVKTLAIGYDEAWSECKKSYFKYWTKKPEEFSSFYLSP